MRDALFYAACRLSADEIHDKSTMFHADLHRLFPADSPPAHVEAGLVTWVSESLSSLLESARDIFERYPLCSISVYAERPSCVVDITATHTLHLGTTMSSAIEASDRVTRGHVVVEASEGEVFAGFTTQGTGFAMYGEGRSRSFLIESEVHGDIVHDWISDERWESASWDERIELASKLTEQAIAELYSYGELHYLPVLDESLDRILMAIEVATRTNEKVCASMLIGLGRWASRVWLREEVVEACRHLVERMPLRAGSMAPQTLDLHLLHARQLNHTGHTRGAIELIEALLDHVGAPLTAGLYARCELIDMYLFEDRDAEAQRCIEHVEALVEDEEISSSHALLHRAKAAYMLARCEVSDVHTRKILYHLERAYAIAQDCGDRQLAMRSAGEWANIISFTEPELAARRAAEVLDTARSLRTHHYVTIALSLQTDIAIRLNLYGRARSTLESSYQALDPGDEEARLFIMQQEALLWLFEVEYERANVLIHELEREAKEFAHPQFLTTIHDMELISTAFSGQLEQLSHMLQDDVKFGPLARQNVLLWNDVLRAEEDEVRPALEAMCQWLLSHNGTSRYSEWILLFWHRMLALDPEYVLPRFGRPCLVVGPQSGWFITTYGSRIELAHRQYLYLIFSALVTQRERDAMELTVDDLFHIGWPGESVHTKTKTNRVYVAISKLRDFGLGKWLTRGRRGYVLSTDFMIVRVSK